MPPQSTAALRCGPRARAVPPLRITPGTLASLRFLKDFILREAFVKARPQTRTFAESCDRRSKTPSLTPSGRCPACRRLFTAKGRHRRASDVLGLLTNGQLHRRQPRGGCREAGKEGGRLPAHHSAQAAPGPGEGPQRPATPTPARSPLPPSGPGPRWRLRAAPVPPEGVSPGRSQLRPAPPCSLPALTRHGGRRRPGRAPRPARPWDL